MTKLLQKKKLFCRKIATIYRNGLRVSFDLPVALYPKNKYPSL